MAGEPAEIGSFAFAVRLLSYPDSRREYQTGFANNNVPVELVIMQLKSLLRNMKNEYFDDFDRRASEFKK